MTLRVVQWTTGNVGKQSVQAIVRRPDLDLVGCYAWSPDKAGRDVGTLCGIDPIGIAATNDIDALLALQPDCIVYNPMWRDIGEMVRILESGANIVSSAAFVTGHALGADRERLVDACARGGSSMFGSGISPGFVELLAIVAAGACDRIDKVTVVEEADTTEYDSPDTEIAAGFGLPIDDPELPQKTATGTAVFGDAVRMIGDALGVEFDEIRCVPEYAQTTVDLEMASWTIAAGCVAGIYASWQGRVGDRTIVELSFRWRKGQTLEPDWKVGMGHTIEIAGRPTINLTLSFLPPPDFAATTMAEFMVLGHIMTAVPVVNAIPAVVAAPPGIVTYTDLALPLPSGYAL
jgi:hypothetical protein